MPEDWASHSVNMGWMHDMLEYFGHEPVHRFFHQNQITFGLLYAFNENFVLVLSHDEVVHGKRALLDKMPGDAWQRFANLRSLYGFMYGHPARKCCSWAESSGSGVSGTTTPAWNGISAISSQHVGLQRLVRDLNWLYRQEPALHELDHDWTGFQWIDFSDAAIRGRLPPKSKGPV